MIAALISGTVVGLIASLLYNAPDWAAFSVAVIVYLLALTQLKLHTLLTAYIKENH